MEHELSILIPCYNDLCTDIVATLREQAEAIGGLKWELLVGDDGSTNDEIVAENRKINGHPNCRYIEYGENKGRAAIRNTLAKEAKYPTLFFTDCGVSIPNVDFLQNYIKRIDDADVIYGGVTVIDNESKHNGNLRFKYEKNFEKHHPYNKRQRHPYKSFRSCNFLIKKELFLNTGFDKDIKGYGYEDVALGKHLEEVKARVLHIDNPVTYTVFESNEKYLAKTLESLNTLYENKEKLRGYSSLLKAYDTICKYRLRSLFLYIYNKVEKKVENNLKGDHPNIHVFQLFRLGNIMKRSDRE